MVRCYMNNRQEEYFAENMSACGHHYGSLDHLSTPEITSRPRGENNKCVCACMEAPMYASAFVQSSDVQISNTCLPVSLKP